MKRCLVQQGGAFLLALAAVTSSPAADLNAIFNRQLDFNDNGLLEKEEILVGLIHRNTKLNLPALRKKAARNHGRVPSSVFEDLDMQPLEDEFSSLESLYPGIKFPVPVDRLHHRDLITTLQRPGPDVKDLEKYPKQSRWDFALRRTREKVIGALDNPVEGEVAKLEDPYAEGALFSYRRDLKIDQDVWTARGALGLKYSLLDNPDFKPPQPDPKNGIRPAVSGPDYGSLNDFSWILATTFDRVNTRGTAPGVGAKEIDYLAFETGFSGLWAWGTLEPGPLGVSALQATGTVGVETDFELRKKVWGASIDLLPHWNISGLNKIWTPRWAEGVDRLGRRSRLFWFRFSMSVHLEAGVVEEEGSSDKLRLYDSYARIGGKLTAELHLFPDYFENRLSIEASYERYQGLLAHNGSPDLFRATSRYVLPIHAGRWSLQPAAGDSANPYAYEQGSLLWALQVEYLKGDTPFLEEEDHSVTVGLSVAF